MFALFLILQSHLHNAKIESMCEWKWEKNQKLINLLAFLLRSNSQRRCEYKLKFHLGDAPEHGVIQYKLTICHSLKYKMKMFTELATRFRSAEHTIRMNGISCECIMARQPHCIWQTMLSLAFHSLFLLHSFSLAIHLQTYNRTYKTQTHWLWVQVQCIYIHRGKL